MSFKINISQKNGKTWKLESEDEILVGKSIREKFSGKEISPDLDGYELEITGASDIAGFPHKADVEGPELKRVLLTKGWGMHAKKSGLRKKKTIRGKQISDKTVQINIITHKEGAKKLEEIFPEQNISKAPKESPKEEPTKEEKPMETPKEEKIEKTKPPTEKAETPVQEKAEKIAEEISEEVKEEIEEDIPTSPETKSEEKKEEAAEKVAEEVKEELEEVAEEIAEEEKKDN